MQNYSKNLITILTIFSINLYTLEDKTMNKRATEYNLNEQQFELLKIKYIMTIVDSMSTEDFRQFVIGTYEDDLSNYTLSRLIEEIKYTLDDEMLDEFITTIKGESREQMYYEEDKERDYMCITEYNLYI